MARDRSGQWDNPVCLVSYIQHQKAFLTYAFGGAEHWNGRSMWDAHQELVAEMGLTDSHFDAIAKDLVPTLVEMEVPQALIDEVVQIVGSTASRNDVLNR